MKKLLLLPLLFLSFAQAETIQCKVVGVTDGDTITCLTDQKERIKVRLYQINAPEATQAYGQNAKKALSDMVFGKTVDIDAVKKDQYKRILGTIIYRNFEALQACEDRMNEQVRKSGIQMTWECNLPTQNINLEMLKQGYAWHDPFDTKNPEYLQAEQEAREAGRGLWADKDPMSPWEWRKQQKKPKKQGRAKW